MTLNLITVGKNFRDLLYLAIWPTKRWMATVLTVMSLKAASEEGAVFCVVGVCMKCITGVGFICFGVNINGDCFYGKKKGEGYSVNLKGSWRHQQHDIVCQLRCVSFVFEKGDNSFGNTDVCSARCWFFFSFRRCFFDNFKVLDGWFIICNLFFIYFFW